MKIDRLVSIIMILLEKQRIGAIELANQFEVSVRTIYRDIDAINMAGIPVRSIPGVGGGFEIMPNYKIDKKVFSTAELSTILMGLSGLANTIRGDELENALAKVKSFIPAEKAKDIEFKANQIHIDMNPWFNNKNICTNIELVQFALQERQILSFDYIDQHGNRTNRNVEPHQLVMKSSNWYLYGYCHKRNDFRLFRLSRILNMKTLKETFEQREYDKPLLNADDIIASMKKDITLRIHKSVMDMVLDYCSYDCFIPDGEDYYIVKFPFIENDYYYNQLLGLGDKCECLSPPHIRKEMLKRIHNMISLYKD